MTEGALKIWWIPQVPGEAFEVEVGSLEQADLLLTTLARYDAFQFDHNIKPDYCNAGGLLCFEGGEWSEWWDENGYDFDEVRSDPILFAAAVIAERAKTGSVAA